MCVCVCVCVCACVCTCVCVCMNEMGDKIYVTLIKQKGKDLGDANAKKGKFIFLQKKI